MKAKILKILAIMAISFFIAYLFLILFFSENSLRNPEGILHRVIAILPYLIIGSISLIIFLLIFKEKNPNPQDQKRLNKPLNKESFFKDSRTLRLFEEKVPTRMILFLFIGFFYVIYFFVSVVFFKKFDNFTLLFIPIFMLFWIIYPIIYFLILIAIDFLKKFYKWIYIIVSKENILKKIDKGDENGRRLLYDIFGYYLGAVVGFVFVVLCAIIGVFILIGKGIIWLTLHPSPLGILTTIVVILVSLTFFIYAKFREFNDFLDSLSFFPDFKL